MSEVETYINVQGDIVPASLQPPQSALQNAFRMNANKTQIVIDMTAAREEACNMIRRAREPLFLANDAAYTRAQQRGDDIAAYVAKGEQLRDAPADARIDAASTPEALLAAVEAIVQELESNA